MDSVWSHDEVEFLSRRFGIKQGQRLHSQAEDFHFPENTFLANGYAPPGGYVKDFGIIRHEDRFHLFHIDGRPGQKCSVTGDEISFGHASTVDFRRWIRHRMPLAVGQQPWESEHVWAPYVHRRDDLFYMFYMGSGQGQTFISYATSPDLEIWTRRSEGPITCAVGRDPFVYDDQGRTILVYTGHGGARVAACASRDMVHWEPLPDLINISDAGAAESASLHRLRDGHVLWFNDYGRKLVGFRAAYALSSDPYRFDPKDINEFDFQTDIPGAVASPELPVGKPLPLSIELIARGDNSWLVAYFCWHMDRNRLFLGELHWDVQPAQIREIRRPEQMESALRHHTIDI